MKGKKPRIILDTNVLYAGLYSSQGASFKVLQAIERDEVQIVLSTTLLFEYEDILKRHQTVLGLSDEEIQNFLDYFCLKSEHQRIYFLWRPILSDQKDDHLFEVAVASGTDLIVTHNTRDFKATAKFGISALTPKELMERML